MPSPFYAVIFDLDGVLADSEPWWNQIDAKLLAEYGVSYHGEYHRNVLGVSYRLAVEFYKNACSRYSRHALCGSAGVRNESRLCTRKPVRNSGTHPSH